MFKFRLTPIAAALLPAFGLGHAWAGPSGGTVVAGDAGISTPDTHTTVVTQNSQGAVINWQQFSVGSQEYVVFNQPNASAAILNRVVGGNPSEILGQIQSNGRVFLINPNGVLFGQGSQLDVGSLTASTLDISNDDFMAGRYRFAGNSVAPVVNQGRITAADGGYVVLAGDSVSNSGLIQARLGDVVLASGSAVTLDVSGSGLIGYSIDAQALSDRAGVENLGTLVADGGMVVMDARVARTLIGAAVNNSGRVQAQSIDEHGGEVWLSARGGDVVSSGVIDVAGSSTATDAGSVRMSSDGDITLAAGAQILASGHGGGDGGDVRLIAERTLAFSRGAGLIARGGADDGKGGFVELSGHDEFWLAGDIDLGSGGHLLIDPDDLIVENGYGSAGANTIYEEFIESQLQNGTDVSLAATSSITFRNLLDDQLDGRAAGTGGSLYVDVTGSAGSIAFDDLDDAILIDGSLSMTAGQTGGTIAVGHLTARDLYLRGGDGISAGDLAATAGSVSLDSSAGDIDLGDITARYVGSDPQRNGATSAINISAYGGLSTGDLSATSEVTDDTANATASIDLSSENGSVSTGALSVEATAVNGYARAAIYIDADTRVTTGDVSVLGTGGFVDPDGDGIAEGEASFQIGNGSTPIDISLGNISVHDAVGEESGEVISLYINGGSGTTAFGTVNTDGGVHVKSIGSIETLDLDARTVVLESGSIQAGDITTLNDVRLTAASGNITAGTLTAYSADVYSAGGDITLGDVLSAGYVGLQSGGAISAGRIEAGGTAYISGGNGDVDLGNVSVSSGNANANLYIGSSAGSITADTVTVHSEGQRAAAEIRANGDLLLGALDISGGGSTSGEGTGYGDLAGAYLSAGGDLTVTGDISIVALANEYESAQGDGSIGETRGDARLSADGNRIDLQSDVSVRGVGDVALELFGILSVDIGGDTVVDAGAATYEYAYGGLLTVERGGLATIDISAYGGGLLAPADLRITTGNLSASGPSVNLTLDSGRIVVGDIELLAAAAGSAAGAYSRVERDGVTVAESNFGIALLGILASGGNDSDPAISTGDLTVHGPSAQALLFGNGIVVDGAIDLRGTGFDISGDWNELAYDARPDLFNFFGTLNTPLLDSGAVHWGGAGLTIAGYTDPEDDTGNGTAFETLPSAGQVSTGAISIRGIGEARARIAASSYDSGGAALLIDARSDGAGSVLGEYADFQQIGDDSYTVTHRYDDGSGGAARYGRAELNLFMDGSGDATLGDLTLLGYSVDAGIDGGGKLTLGDVTLLGASGEEAPIVRERITYAAGEGGGVLDPVTLSATGDVNVFSVGHGDTDDLGFSSVVAGDISVSGAGFAGLAIEAGSIATGEISLSASLGRLFDSSIGLDETLGDVAVILGGEAPATIAGLSVDAARHVYLGVNAVSSGDIDIVAGQQLMQLLPGFLLDFEHPLEVERQPDFGMGAALGDGDLALIDTQLSTTGAADIRIRLGEDSTLGNLTLDAGGTLELDGAQAHLSLDGATLSGGNVLLSRLSFDTGDMVITADGADPAEGRSLQLDAVDINATTLMLSAADSIRISGSALNASATLILSGDGSLDIDNSSLTASALRLSAGDLLIEDAALAGDLDLQGSGDILIRSSALTGNTASLQAAGLLRIAGDAYGGNSTLSYAQTLALSSSGGTVELEDSAFSSATLTLTSLGDIRIVSSSIDSDVDLDGDGDLLISDSSLFGATGAFVAQGDVRVENGSVLIYDDSLDIASTSGGIVISASQLGSNPGNNLDKALGAGDISLQASLNLLLQDSLIEGATVALTALGGDVGDGGSGSTIDAAGLGVRSGGDIDFGASSLIVGSGAAPFGGDPDVIDRLDTPLRPSSTTPNASFVAPGAVRLGAMDLGGDYLFIQTDSIAFSGPIGAPDNLLVQLLPFDLTGTLGLENAAAALRDINLNAGDHFPALARPTILIGGSGYSGNIYVGENGQISIPELTNVVFVTSGEVRNPVRINTSGQVLVLDGTVINDSDSDPLQNEIEAIQNQVNRPISYEAPLQPLPEDRDLIEQQTNSQTELVCR